MPSFEGMDLLAMQTVPFVVCSKVVDQFLHGLLTNTRNVCKELIKVL